MKKSFQILSALLLSGSIVTPALATMDPSELKGVEIRSLEVPGRRPELCVIPLHIPGVKYKKKDSAHEDLLCSLNIDVTAATCAKTNSTNPGVNFFTSETLTPEQLIAAECEAEDSKKQAKYKLSTSCSYTPSLLAYYHVSRALGNVLNVPLAVIRTMDIDRHRSIAKKALSLIGNKEELIYKTWSSLKSALDAGKESKRADLLFVDGYEQSYGALQRNPRGEEKYPEFYNGGADQPARAANFKKKSPIYKDLISSTNKVPREFNQENVQRFVQMRDAADMILIDTILSQQDRFGNVAAEIKYYYAGKKDGVFQVKSDDQDELPAKVKDVAFAIKEVMLKDNDCGIVKSNTLKDAKLLQGVAHMSPQTYKNLLLFQQFMNTNEAHEYFEHEILATDHDIRAIQRNLNDAVELLQERCKDGDLKLDLDLDIYFSGAELPTSYSCTL